jgi:2-iminobutanoate/2-iminopropanoate deaminase
MFKRIVFVFIVILFLGCDSDEADQVTKEIIKSPDAPAAIGPYSQAIKVGNTLYCSGQIAIDPKTGELVTENIEAETKQVLDNLGAVLKEAGMDYSDVVQATVYMTDMENYKRINEVYGQYFTKNPPSRVAVQVANLPKYVNVEISCIAVKSE